MTGNIEISIGHGTFVGDHTKLTGGIGGIRIGENCDISDNVIICSGSHNLGDRYRRAGVGTGDDILIGDGAWIGLGAIVLSGVTIGKGAVIGAGAVVVGDVPENSLVAGNPAVVKRIFLDE
ncbi:MAG: acyltransferase [Porticoccaceae bacterium]|nr:acyltransferase [Porticoccaceae bacterium]